MSTCKYCRRRYDDREWLDLVNHRREIPNRVCPTCYYGVGEVKEMGRVAVDVGKKVVKSIANGVSSFLEERKRRQKEPSCKPRIRSTNDCGYDDILALTDIQWIILSERQLKTIRNRINDGLFDVPDEVVVKHTKEVARRYRNVEAMLIVGRWYRDGKGGVEQDYKEAFSWFNKAAELYDPEGLLYVGVFYDRGMGVKKNPKKAAEYYRQAAHKGDRIACHNIAICYSEGSGVEKSEVKAFEWMLKSAEKGFVNAQKCVGDYYYEGFGVEKSDAEAFEWMLKAAENGSVDAQRKIGDYFWDGTGVKRSEKCTFEWWLRAAQAGDSLATNNVGVLYYKGIGTKKDTKKAKEFLLAAAKQGEDLAKKHLLEYFKIKV